MILPDTSIWIDHLSSGDSEMATLLASKRILAHPFVIGEIMLGSLRARSTVRAYLEDLRKAVVAEHQEVLDLVERHSLYGSGIGYVDAHLLASVKLSQGSRLWTRDKRLAAAAAAFDLAHALPQ